MRNIKNDIHEIIDSIHDQDFLEMIYDILQNKEPIKGQRIWKSLNNAQKSEVLKASDEINDTTKQTSHERMIEKNKKWLEK